MRSRLLRHLLTLMVPSGLLCLIFVAALYHENQLRVRQNLEAGEALRVSVGARSLTSDLDVMAGDIRLIAALPSLAAVLGNADHPALSRLTADLVALSASHRVYDQLRWIDETGRERVRVDYLQNEPFVVPEERLQNKAQRYFFSDTMKLGPGEIYVSPLDLNIEQGRVETPLKPTLRLAMRVADQAGKARGIVIANYFASFLIARFDDITQSHDIGARVSLLNREGYWLSAPQAADEWGFMFDRKDNFATRYPEVWRRISSSERGQFEDDRGLWSFQTVRPLQGGKLAGSPTAMGGDDYVWKVVSQVPGEVLMQLASRNLMGWILITLVFMGTLFVGSLVLAKALQRRDAMAENLRALNLHLEDEVRQRTEELRQQAMRDPLTGLFNRRYLAETLPREIYRALREEKPLAVVMIDLDHFKRFNDQWGHEAGDAVLIGVAAALLDGLRVSDIGCRYGGEELLVVMPGADAEEAIRRISTIAEQSRMVGARVMGRELDSITFSAGVATVPDHGNNAEMLIRAADRALYMAKETGRDRIVVAHLPGAAE